MTDHLESLGPGHDQLITCALPVLLGCLTDGQPPARMAAEVASLAARMLPGVDEVSIALLVDDGSSAFAFSGSLAATLDERQYGPGFGPALDAAGAGSLLRVDTATNRDYCDFTAAARRQGVSNVIALALPMSADVRGAMTLYRRHQPTPISEDDLAVAVTFASHAAKVLLSSARAHRRERLIANLQAAMQSRSTIEQAKGVLMARLACDPDEAFRQLVRTSQTTSRKVRDVASDLVLEVAQAGTRQSLV